MRQKDFSSYRILVIWLWMQVTVSVAAGQELSSLTFREQMLAAELEMPQSIVLQSEAVSVDPFEVSSTGEMQVYAGESERSLSNDPLANSETVQAARAAEQEFKWCALPWLLVTFTASKLCETATAMTEYPQRWTKSRWAMDDPEYAHKYARGASKRDIPGKLKQAVDARFIEGSSGWYLSLGASKWADSDSVYASLEGGYEGYWTSYFTSRVGLAAAINEENVFGGVDLGARVQVPSRLAPFVGVGLFAGAATKQTKANNDNIDNDKDGFVDEPDETARAISGLLAAIYPEAGVHFWWTPRVRMTVYSRYLMTTDGRSTDTWYAGGGLALMSGR